MIILRKLKQEDKKSYFDAANQEPGGLKFVDGNIISDGMWKVALECTGESTFAIEDVETKAFCGYCSVDLDDEYPEIGINLCKDFQGRGIGVESIQKLMKYAVTQKDIEYFYVRIIKENSRSLRMFKKLGAIEIEAKDSNMLQNIKKLEKENSDDIYIRLREDLEKIQTDSYHLALYCGLVPDSETRVFYTGRTYTDADSDKTDYELFRKAEECTSKEYEGVFPECYWTAGGYLYIKWIRLGVVDSKQRAIIRYKYDDLNIVAKKIVGWFE